MRINKETKVNTVFGIKSNITLDRLIKAINQSSAIIEDNKEYLIEGYLTKRDEDYSRINIEKFIERINKVEGSFTLDGYVHISFYESRDAISVEDEFFL